MGLITKTEMIIAELGSRGIPSNFIETELTLKYLKTNYEDDVVEAYRKIYRITKNWVKNIEKRKIGLFFTGSNGSGKSYLSCQLLKMLYEKGIEVYRTTLSEILNYYCKNWRMPSFCHAKLILVIDEVGKEINTNKGYSEHCLETILKSRSEYELPTIIISNADFKYISKRYGETVASVMKGTFLAITFPEIDIRDSFTSCITSMFNNDRDTTNT